MNSARLFSYAAADFAVSTAWTVNAEDLRPAHLVGTRITQDVPNITRAVSWLLPPTVALHLAGVTAAAGWTWLTLGLFRRTVAGQPLPRYIATLT